MIAGAVPDDVACTLHTITEFIFQAQNLFLYDKTLHLLTEALCEFHHYKVSIITAGGHRGKNGPLNHFQIPKLELMQHVVQSTRAMGAPYQWSSDITERCHITHVKQPYCMTDHKDFHVLKSQQASLIYKMSREANAMALHYPEATWISTVLPDEQYNFCLQWRSTQDSRVVSPAHTIQALPPSSLMPFGRGNTVLIAHKSGELLSPAASKRYAIVQVKSILQPITEAPYLNQPFLYVDFFNFSHSLINTFDSVHIVTPAPVTDMFLVHCRV
ncbi:uncharacterized protein BJ212DRAFT_1295109 [Suillus subaureus]|uniref:Uncharacterized protein n=1 Tax=Suillus subaureus TaxID=48587 RepID=A0A9P7EM14_9AGAM|nr:uncharacterized protein BJ212DRAFT_1295109 [Suillus subaureus]KAG1825737.1 hypothetical protein BJ212DRAFT_1295109 [Suillus subaureus]